MSTSVPLATEGLGLRVGLADPRWLVRGLSVTFEVGTITAVVGPNGAGKSTLLRCLANLTAAREGRVMLGGQPLGAWRPRARAKAVAYLPQVTPIVVDMRVQELVALGRAPYRGRLLGGTPSDHHVHAALSCVQATDLAKRSFWTLSGGERQRVLIARMLATGAKHLLVDEPTAALDVGHALSLHALLRTLAEEGRSIVVAMHDLDAARRLADVAICLDRRQADGHHHHGPASTVLGPDVLGPIFGVQVTEVAGSLRFAAAQGAIPEP